MPTTRRPWPIPSADEADFIIRDPAQVERLADRALKGDRGARYNLLDHYRAVEVSDGIRAVLARYQASRTEA